MVVYRYLFTCKKCGSHHISEGPRIKEKGKPVHCGYCDKEGIWDEENI